MSVDYRELKLQEKELKQALDVNLVRLRESFEQVSAVSESIDALTMAHGPSKDLKSSAFLLDEVSTNLSRVLGSLSKRLAVLKYYKDQL